MCQPDKHGIYAFTDDIYGVAGVSVRGQLDDYLHMLLPEQADRLGDMLKQAAAVARGDVQRPNPLQEFIERRKS